ncbi:hypothetical protein CASFOL_035274 [Castilleja foliolosa]|uniref:B30.2/SPRY domain-containing protein n=1 Tax=Castilleja foliolosa TaxID=1961234 RepID=A0ABD3BSX2_9LAMI
MNTETAAGPPPPSAGLTTFTTAELSCHDNSDNGTSQSPQTDQIYPNSSPNSPNRPQITNANDEEQSPPRKKQKQLFDSPKPEMTELSSPADTTPVPAQNGKPSSAATKSGKKSKKKSKDIWTTTSRKAKKKTKHAFNGNHTSKNAPAGDPEDKVLITPIPRFPDKNDDSIDLKICLSKSNKAEKVEISEDRLTAGSTKGYRMVRATRGVNQGAWYFEIKVVHLGETGHTRLGWSTDKGDLQAPVGYDGNSFGYRDIDGSRVHKALREKYGDGGYKEDDVIGFYISLPDGGAYTPKPPSLVWYKGQRYVCTADPKEDPHKVVPDYLDEKGSEISFFRNGICQGVAFTDLYGGYYYPAASMYTLPNQPNCVVKFNFGPDFEKFPDDFGARPVPKPMIEVPYKSLDFRVENNLPGEKKQ